MLYPSYCYKCVDFEISRPTETWFIMEERKKENLEFT